MNLHANQHRSPWLAYVIPVLIVMIVGAADYATGWEFLFSVFYLLAVAIAAWFRGWPWAFTISVLSVAVSLGGDLANNGRYSSPLVPWWNASIVLLFHVTVVFLLVRLRDLYGDLEHRVKQRTADLTGEMAERERLERELLQISERERRSIGHDLHDGLGQHLTGTALTGHLLAEKLAEREAAETADARKVVSLVKEAIEQTRQMAKGLLLADIEAEGLAAALQEFSTATTEKFRVDCSFAGDAAVRLAENGVASHLYRIAREAVHNALRHGRARHIQIRLSRTEGQLSLSIDDDGFGLPPPGARNPGLGLRIMAHRARVIGGSFSIEAKSGGGTLVTCLLPLPSA